MATKPILPREYDAVVVGARCAGAATAMLLARRGLSVLMVDRGVYGSDTLSTHALMRGAVMQLERWGLLDAVRRAGTPPVTKATFHYGDEAISVAIRPVGNVDALYAPRRMVLDRILVDAAEAAGVEIRFGTSLTGLRRDAEGRVTGAVLRDASGAAREVGAGIVIGADGVRSTVARLVDAKAHVEGKAAAGVVFGYFPGLANEGYRWYYGSSSTAGAIPTNGGEHCVFAAMPAEMLRDGSERPEARFRTILAATAPEVSEAIAGIESSGRLRLFGGVRGFLRQASGPGWALVGDAGYFKDPVTAHGITDAFRDAELLARAVAVGTDRALEDYQHLRDALSLPLFRVTDAVAALDWTLDELKVRLAGLNEAMQTETSVLGAIAASTPLPPLDASKGPAELAMAV